MAYTINEQNLERQLLLAQILEPYTRKALQPIALQPGSRLLDLGCGLGETTRLLARLYPTSLVVGLDQDAALLELAESKKASADTMIQFVYGDAARLPFPDNSFDLVFARFLLVHLSDPQGELAEMKRVCKPGGWVIAQEPDHGIIDCYPESFAYQKLKCYFQMLYPDALIGRKLESYFKTASLEQVSVQTSIASEMGHEHQIKRVFRLTGQAIGQALLGKQLLTYQELEDFTRELARIEEDNTTFLLSTLFIAASGRA